MAALVQESRRTSRLAGRAVLASQSDARLAGLAADGHERAFDVLVDRYRAPLIRHCRRILPASRAEDAVQQAFINAHAALLRGDAPTDFKPWLYRVAHNAGLNMLRQNGWNYEPIPSDVDGVPRPDQIVEQRIELQQTVAAIGELPERQRGALVMRELEGRSYAEIAALLGTGDGAVRQLLNRARAAVRSAATMMTPPPLVARAASNWYPDGSRAARVGELLGGLGAGGVVKVGATALVAGSIVVGAVQAPLIGHHGRAASPAADAAAAHAKAASAKAAGANAAEPSSAAGATKPTRGRDRAVGHGRAGAPHRSAGQPRRAEEHGNARQPRSGTGERPSSGGDGSGSGDRSGTIEHSGSSGSGDTSGSSSSGSGTSGSSDGSGTSGGSSGSSGGELTSGTSGETASGSGTSGSTTTSTDGGTSGTSGSSGTGTDGSTTSGTSGTSGGDGVSGSSTTTSSSTSGSSDSGSTTTSSGSGDSTGH